MSETLASPRGKRGPAAVLPPAESSRFYAEIGRKSNADRIILSGDETRALGDAYRLIARIAARHPEKLNPAQSPEQQSEAAEESAA